MSKNTPKLSARVRALAVKGRAKRASIGRNVKRYNPQTRKVERRPAATQKPDVGTSPDPKGRGAMEGTGYVRGPYDPELGGIPVSPEGTLGARDKRLAMEEKERKERKRRKNK